MCLEVITGTMFGGKSTELLRRLERAIIAGQTVYAFSKDTRYEKGCVTTHSGHSLKGMYVDSSQEIHEYLLEHPDVQVVGIDECQFFDIGLLEVCRYWSGLGKRVIVAGLDQDFSMKAFEVTTLLLAEAEIIDKLLAICIQCGNDAVRNHLKIESDVRIVEGASESYEALCRTCYNTANTHSKLS